MEPYSSNPNNSEYTGAPYIPPNPAGQQEQATPNQAAAEQPEPAVHETQAPQGQQSSAAPEAGQPAPEAGQAAPEAGQPAPSYWNTWQNATGSNAWTNQDANAGVDANAGAAPGAGNGDGQGNNAYSAAPAATWDSQNTPGTQGGQDTGWSSWGAPQATQQAANSWEPYGNGWQNPSTHQYVYTPTQGAARQPRPEHKKGKAPRMVAMLLACSLFGFGGGVLANQLNGNTTAEPTVVYKTPEGNNTSADTSGNLSLADVAAIAKASVVAIETENIVKDFNMGGQVVSGAGSGVIISEDGTIITNHHVVDGARSVIVRMEDGTEYGAKVLGSDKRSDIAVLKIDATGLTPAIIGDSASLAVGEYCLAVGNPTGALEGTVTDGIISAVNRSVTIDGNAMTLLQMSAAVSPGNSGGGLFSTRGELVGIVNAKSDGDSVEGLGFAIPVNDAMAVAEELIAHGVVTRPGLGVTIMDLTNERYAEEAGVDKPGIYINSVSEGSAAERAGLRAGDRVVSVEGAGVNSTDDLSSAIAAKKVGDKLAMVVERNGQEIEIEATLGVLES